MPQTVPISTDESRPRLAKPAAGPVTCCGIDEAGYGPMLGPLVVAMAVFQIDEWDHAAKAPDLWDLLSDAVCTAPRDAKSRIAVADSKRLKLPNSSKTRHPLTHLERGVLAFLRAAGLTPPCDASLFDTIGAELDDAPWYAGEPTPLPLAGDAAKLAIDANRLAAAARRSGVRLVSLRVRVVGERRFNDIIREHGSKAAATSSAITSLIAEARRRWGADHPLRLVVDRQSGRADYRPLLADALPGAEVSPIAVSPERSSYNLTGDGLADARAHFMTEAENAHLPVALASMTAKLVRELAMARFNRHWCGRIEGLRPTAGYVTDARRWLADAGDRITSDERAAMVRLA